MKKEKQKVGTIWCKLFGHKFLFRSIIQGGGYTKKYVKPVNYCIRCGFLRKPKVKFVIMDNK